MRLEHIPTRYEAFHAESPDLSLCRVASREKGLYWILGADGTRQARVSGKFQHDVKSASDYPAVGDYVLMDLNDDTAIVRRVLPRTSVFLRKAAGVAVKVWATMKRWLKKNMRSFSSLDDTIEAAWDYVSKVG